MSSHPTTPTVDLTGHFLIAMPAMVDKNFSRTLTLVCEHNEQGALGVIVNKPIDMSLDDLFERIDLTLESPRFQGQPVYFGGPVQTDRGFVLHRPIGDFQSSIDIGNGLALTSSRDVLQALGGEHEPDDVLVTLGYAGWQAGQIEWELAQNAWLTVRADPQIIFALPPEERLVAAMQLLGVDYATLSDVAGHA